MTKTIRIFHGKEKLACKIQDDVKIEEQNVKIDYSLHGLIHLLIDFPIYYEDTQDYLTII